MRFAQFPAHLASGRVNAAIRRLAFFIVRAIAISPILRPCGISNPSGDVQRDAGVACRIRRPFSPASVPASQAPAKRRYQNGSAGVYSFSDELGGFTHHRRQRHRQQGRPDRHHRGAQFGEPGHAGHPRDDDHAPVHARRRCADRLHAFAHSSRSTTAALPGSSSSSSCRRSRTCRARSATGSPSTSGARRPTTSTSNSFAEFSRDFEPYDRLRFRDGKVDPLETATFNFFVTDFTPRSQFYIVQDPRIPSS